MNRRYMTGDQGVGQGGWGLVGWLESTRVELPLKGVECRFRVCGDLLSVELDQIFHVNTTGGLDCTYSFPLPAGAAVHRCELHVNGRVIRARVEERARAEALAREHKAAGHRTTLVTMERENLFTLELGNLQPGDVAIIRLAYFETLTRLEDWTSFRIPFSPGVRYIPGRPLLRRLQGHGVVDDTDQVPDASRVTPPRIGELHPDAAYLSLEGVLEDPWALVRDVSSSTHPVQVRPAGRQSHVRLADGGAVPAGDFVLRWSETVASESRGTALALRGAEERHALVLLTAPPTVEGREASPQDYYFLLDGSGSMAGEKWEKAVQALRAFLTLMRPVDRAWVGVFSNGVTELEQRPTSGATLLASEGLGRLERNLPGGGTELLPALEKVFSRIQCAVAGRLAQLVVITDGQVGNEVMILERMRTAPPLVCHTFGVDQQVNDALLRSMAAEHRGTCCLMQPTDDIAGAVSRLAGRLRPPVLTGLTAGPGWEFPDDAVVNLHAGDRLTLSLRGRSGAGLDGREVVIAGLDGAGQRREFRFPIEECSEPALRLLWASRRIQRCLRAGERKQAMALARQHNLICDGMAFIAWDDQERVPVAVREVYQPSLEPAIENFFAADARLLCKMELSLPLTREESRMERLFEAAPATLQPEFAVDWGRGMMDVLGPGSQPEYAEMLHLLIEWLLLGRAERLVRMDSLRALLEGLKKTPQDDLSARVAFMRQWAVERFGPEGGDTARFLGLVHQWEQQVRARQHASGAWLG